MIQVALVIAVMTIIGILVFNINDEGRSGLSDTTYSVVNETLTLPSNITATTFISNINQCGFGSLSVSVITNASSGATIPATNYTVESGGSILRIGQTWAFNDWNASYSYTHKDFGCNVTLDADKAQGTLFSNLDLVALAVIFGVIIFLIMKVLPFKMEGF